MALGYTLESVIVSADDAFKTGVTTLEGQKEYLRSKLPEVIDTPDQVRTFFEKMLPGQNVTKFEDHEMRQRRLDHANAHNTWLHLAAEYGSIEKNAGPKNELRFMGAVYKPERTQEDIDYNKNLRDAIGRGDFAEVGRIYSEHIMNLPSFDPEMIQSLPDKDIPQVFRELYPLSVAAQEGFRFLGEKDNENVVAMREAMSPESKERLAELIQYMDAFATLKIRCDSMFSPFYPYVDISKLACSEENIQALAGDVPEGTSDYLARYAANLSGQLSFTANGFGEDAKRKLEEAGIDPAQTTVRDIHGVEHALSDGKDGDCSLVFRRNEPVFCYSGDKLKVFVMEGQKIVEADPKEAVDNYFKKNLTTAFKEAGDLLNSDLAAPRWLFTSSVEYRNMQKAHARYEAAVGGKPGSVERINEEAMNALEDLGKTAGDYFRRKDVNLEDFPNFETFWYKADRNMNSREMARMKAAYDLMETYNNAKSALKTQEEVYGRPSAEEMHRAGKENYTNRVAQSNNIISKSAFLNDPVAAVPGNEAGDRLRQELKETLLDPQKGLLHKTIFSARDRQVAEDVLAKAVILSMIRSGRAVTDPPAQMEKSYLEDPGKTIERIKGTDAFKGAADKFITPDGLRSFLTEHREAKVNREIQTQAREANAMRQQSEPQPSKQLTNEMQAQVAQPDPVPVQPQAAPSVPPMS